MLAQLGRCHMAAEVHKAPIHVVGCTNHYVAATGRLARSHKFAVAPSNAHGATIGTRGTHGNRNSNTVIFGNSEYEVRKSAMEQQH